MRLHSIIYRDETKIDANFHERKHIILTKLEGDRLLKYIFKRILLMIPVLFCIIVIVFTLMYIAPGDPALAILGETASQDQIAQIHKEYGLDRPYLVQLSDYIIKLCKGDMGESYTTKSRVVDEIMARYPTTIKLTLSAAVFGLILGVTAGVISAVKQYSALDKTFTMFSLFGVSAPSFWVAMLLVLLLSVKLAWLPPTGTYGIEYWIMPVFTLGLQSSAYIMRMTRTSMLEVVRQDYIRTARAKGQTELKTIIKHAMRNAMLPVFTALGMQICGLLAGTVLVETVFAIPGISKYLIDCVNNKDFPCVQGLVLWIAINCVAINLIVDVVYCFIDPRLKTAYTRSKNKSKSQPAVNTENRGKAGAISG